MSRTAGHYLLHNSFSSCTRTILGPTTIDCVAVINAFIVSCAPKAKLIILMLKMRSKLHTSLIPRPPLFLLFIPIHKNRPGLIDHVNDIRWKWDTGPNHKNWIICSSILPQFWIPDVSGAKQLLYREFYFTWQPSDDRLYSHVQYTLTGIYICTEHSRTNMCYMITTTHAHNNMNTQHINTVHSSFLK